MKYCEKVYEGTVKNLFWSIKNSGNYVPHNLIKYVLFDLIERTFNREGFPNLACNDSNAFFTSEKKL